MVWANAEKLLERVVSERNIIGQYNVKVMADGGQGFLKICFSVFQNLKDTDNNIRSTYKQGGCTAKATKDTSVYKLILLCIVPNVKETYDNISFLISFTKLNDISFKFVSDFKIQLLVNGQQTATSSYPCPYCFVSLKCLGGLENQAELCDLKTYGDINSCFEKFLTCAKDKMLAKNVLMSSTCHYLRNQQRHWFFKNAWSQNYI